MQTPVLFAYTPVTQIDGNPVVILSQLVIGDTEHLHPNFPFIVPAGKTLVLKISNKTLMGAITVAFEDNDAT